MKYKGLVNKGSKYPKTRTINLGIIPESRVGWTDEDYQRMAQQILEEEDKRILQELEGLCR